jgi:hypothetical protein
MGLPLAHGIELARAWTTTWRSRTASWTTRAARSGFESYSACSTRWYVVKRFSSPGQLASQARPL